MAFTGKGYYAMEKGSLIIYNTEDGKSSVTLTARDGNVWLNQQMLTELFDPSVSNVSRHITNVLEDKELDANSVIEYYAITASAASNMIRLSTVWT